MSPVIIARASFDMINYSYWWPAVLGTFKRRTIGMTGVENHFIITVVVVLLSAILFILTAR